MVGGMGGKAANQHPILNPLPLPRILSSVSRVLNPLFRFP
jgi:hypothetical protein